MTIETLSTAITPQYIPDSGEISRGQENGDNSLSLRNRAGGLPDRKARQGEKAAVVTLSGRPVDNARGEAPSASRLYYSGRTIPVYAAYPYFRRVQEAYAIFEQKNYKGIYVDTLA